MLAGYTGPSFTRSGVRVRGPRAVPAAAAGVAAGGDAEQRAVQQTAETAGRRGGGGEETPAQHIR